MSPESLPIVVPMAATEKPSEDGHYLVQGPTGYRLIVEIDSRNLLQPYVFEPGFEDGWSLDEYWKEHTVLARIYPGRFVAS